MFKDRVVIWVAEYVLGGTLVEAPLAGLALCRSFWADGRSWAVALCGVSLGVILISCASSMRQRMLLAERIDRLRERLDGQVARTPSATP